MALLLLLLATDGLTLHLEADRTVVHAGEFLAFKGTARAGTKSWRPGPYELAIRGPDGTVCRRGFDPDDTAELAAGKERLVLDTRMRINPPHGDWDPRPPPLRDEGAWTAWLAIGDDRSNEVRWDVRPVQIVAEPTAAQREALERFFANSPFLDEDRDLLSDALADARNDGLALHVLDVVEKHRGSAASKYLVANLVGRAASARSWYAKLEYGIDGAYLPRLGRLALEAHEAREKGAAANDDFLMGIDAVVAWVRFHPEEKDARERLVRLAAKSARITDESRLSLQKAWRVLLEVGELRPGMTVAEAVAILGDPNRGEGTSEGPESIAWYLDTPRHVNPGLAARIEGGKVVAFRIYLG